MRRLVSRLILIVEIGVNLAALAQSAPKPHAANDSLTVPSYNISFQQGSPVMGVGSVLAMRLPFDCTSDGTVFITIVQPMGVGSRPSNLAQFAPAMLLTSITTSGEAHSFALDQVPDLYDISDLGHFIADTNVTFLLRAAHGNLGTANAAQDATGASHASPDHHAYAVVFARDGSYQKTIQLGDDFRVTQLGMFPTGNYLVYGYDKDDHLAKLAMLKDDGTVLKYLQVPKDDIPQSALGTLNGRGKGPALYLAPMQFVGRDHSIYILQNKTDFPLLEVSESGEIHEIHPKLPKGEQTQMLIPSDDNLYALVAGADKQSIYELDAETGALVRRLQVNGPQSGTDIACVNGDRFLSFEDEKGKLVPLIGTAEIAGKENSASE